MSSITTDKPLDFFNSKSIQDADIRVAKEGFRYGFIADVLQDGAFERLRSQFPSEKSFKLVDKMSGGGRKRFYVGPGYTAGKDANCACSLRGLSTDWQEFLEECAEPSTAKLLSDSVGVQFNSLANFGLTFGNEGCVQEPHIDGAVREYDESPIHSTWATILYFNEQPDNVSATCVYLPDRTTVLFQAPSMRNGLFFFEQHPSSWHGFPMMPQKVKRWILSLAYSQEQAPIMPGTTFKHRVGCKKFWKDILKR